MATITIGGTVSNRTGGYTTTSTVIFNYKPANAAGIIDTVSIYIATTAATGLKIGVFSGSGTTLTCNSYTNIGDATVGYHTYTGLNLPVGVGDRIGFHMTAGNLEVDSGASIDYYYKSGDHMSDGAQTYSYNKGLLTDNFSLGGSGTSYNAPTVTTQAVSSVAQTSATGNGNIIATGGANATRRGFCYLQGSSGDPTTANSTAYDDGDFGTGAYTKSITGLTAGTAYRVRAYAINSVGTAYGSTVDLTTLASGPSNLKSYNTNLKANIKTINTNPITNVKSLNTNV